MIYWWAGAVPPDAQETPQMYLSPDELSVLGGLRFAKRRREWLNGRYAAKKLLQACDPKTFAGNASQWSIVYEPEGAPYFVHEKQGRLPACLSISHSGEWAFCALTFESNLQVGADVERVETRSRAFLDDYFTDEEKNWMSGSPEDLPGLWPTLAWSAKEAALKALRVGLRLDTRAVEIKRRPGEWTDDWESLNVTIKGQDKKDWQAYWRRCQSMVLTLAMIGMKPGETPRLVEVSLND